jgi:hypothetical protein
MVCPYDAAAGRPCGTKGVNMSAVDLKRKLRNFPGANLQLRVS